ncbi:MAG: hypothetical protein LCI00_07670 [Chloroflexi bacterium]|nr:hypothetical protein [Chloroflexota bacterium]
MNGLLLSQIIVHGLILSVGLSVIILGGMTINPRLMVQDYPPEIKAQLPPMTASEKKQQAVMGLLFWAFALGVMGYSNVQLVARSGENAFIPLFINTYLVFEIANLFDLLVLDYLIVMVLKPTFLFVPGVENLAQYNTFAFHFKGFLKGLMMYGVVIGLVVALVSTLLIR